MRIKLDENVDARLATLLKEAGHDALLPPKSRAFVEQKMKRFARSVR